MAVTHCVKAVTVASACVWLCMCVYVCEVLLLTLMPLSFMLCEFMLNFIMLLPAFLALLLPYGYTVASKNSIFI